MAATAPIKMEMDSPSIKHDPDSLPQSQAMEEDDYEDTGELEMPAAPEKVWLLRVPRVLHQCWDSIDQDQEIAIGVVRRGKTTGKVTMHLDANLPFHQKVERDYDINSLAANSKNTYVFSEKDLPGYKKGARNHRPNADTNRGFSINRSGVDKNKRFQRRVIPKQTRLAHVITHESNCNPVINETSLAIQRQRLKEQEAGIKEVELDMKGGFAPEIQSFMNINKNKKDNVGLHRNRLNKPRSQENKAARMPKNELLDMIFACFKQYKYWSMKALRDELHQPEAYLKELLADIADLVRSGPFNGHYTLKESYRQETYNLEVKEEMAPEESDLEALTGGEDDDMDEAADLKDDPT